MIDFDTPPGYLPVTLNVTQRGIDLLNRRARRGVPATYSLSTALDLLAAAEEVRANGGRLFVRWSDGSEQTLEVLL
jgi:hypothetical protein